MASSAGKRQREQAKLEKAKAKAERRASRQEPVDEPEIRIDRSEPELIEDLGAIHRAFDAGDLSQEAFEARREQLQAQLERLSR